MGLFTVKSDDGCMVYQRSLTASQDGLTYLGESSEDQPSVKLSTESSPPPKGVLSPLLSDA